MRTENTFKLGSSVSTAIVAVLTLLTGVSTSRLVHAKKRSPYAPSFRTVSIQGQAAKKKKIIGSSKKSVTKKTAKATKTAKTAKPAVAQKPKNDPKKAASLVAAVAPKKAEAAQPAQADALKSAQAAPTKTQAATVTSAMPPETAGSTAHLNTPEPAGRKSPLFGLSVSTDISSNLYSTDSPNYSAELGFGVSPKWNITDEYNVAAKLGLTKELTGYRESHFKDTQLLFARSGFQVSPTFDLKPSLAFIFPTSEKSREIKSLYYGTSLTTRLQLSGKRIGAPALSAWYAISGSIFNYEYTTSASGAFNTHYRLANSLFLGYSITDQLSVSVNGASVTGWTYAGDPSTSFEISEEIGFDITGNWSVAVGLTNSGNTYKENGRDSNITFIDDTSAVVYGSVTYSL